MDYTDYLWVKLIVLCGAAAVYHFWLGFTGRTPPGQSKQRDREPR